MTTKKSRAPKEKIFSPAALKKKIKSLKNRRLIFTNGCFDLLHKGHVDYLHRAKKLGGLLIVALNSDSSVKKIKGPSRPLNSLKERQYVIAGLESVDFVTSFSEDTPLKLICLLKPDTLVKGGDWKASQIVGAKEVTSWGGKVKSISFVKGHSTTAIIKKAKVKK